MGLTYHFRFEADATIKPAVLASFLRHVESDAKALGFSPTVVLDAPFDSDERRLFARRLTTGLLVEDARLRGVRLHPSMSFTAPPGIAEGQLRLCPEHGVLLIVTNERGAESAFGFFRYPLWILDSDRERVMPGPGNGAWSYQTFLKTPDPRYRRIVRHFSVAGFLREETDDFAVRTSIDTKAVVNPSDRAVIILKGEFAGDEGICLGQATGGTELWAVSPHSSNRVLNLRLAQDFGVLMEPENQSVRRG
jgi:hypothetical protein